MRRRLPEDRFSALTNPLTGLDQSQVAQNRARFGSNVIVAAPSSTWRDLVRDTLQDPMLWFLAGISALFFMIGDTTEAIILSVALVPILGMDAFLHWRTQASTQALAGQLASSVWVMRDSNKQKIAATELVPGDLAIVTESQPVPADGVIVSGENLQLDESALTGEAMPVKKTVLQLAPEGPASAFAHDSNWVFAGTRLLTGHAIVQIVFTGADTYYGEIAQSAQAGKRERTPLQQQIGALTQWLVVAALVFCVALALTRLLQGHGLVDAIISATTLAVAALPEEFPVVFSFFLGVGVYRLAREKALVRRAVVVENIGRVSCICSDKTGTLTEGQLRLSQVDPAPGVDRSELLQAAATASRQASGDPLDAALLDVSPSMPGVARANFPFTEDRRREACVIQTASSALVCFVKGAPETIFQRCRLSEEQQAEWREKTRMLASSGRKVIGCCRRELALHDWDGEEPQTHYEFLGLIAFEDPVRVGVPLAIAQAHQAGIRVIMVTGDHPDTARAIAQAIGLGPAQEIKVIEGETLASVLATQGINGLREVSVIARAMPAQKLALVRALQASGEIVAVTGDGVNDVPALQSADIGIAMGERGTRAAREAAAIVLMDDNFQTIVRAIAEGQQLFHNLQRSFAYLLMVHIALVASAAWIPLQGFPLLYLPVHIVWLELIIHPTALLAFQARAHPGPLRPRPRKGKAAFFSQHEWAIIVAVGALLTFVLVFGYEHALLGGRDVNHARTMALASLILASATITLSLSAFSERRAIIVSGAGILVSVLLIQWPLTSGWLHLTPLHFDDWLLVAASGVLAGLLAALLPRAARQPQAHNPQSTVSEQ